MVPAPGDFPSFSPTYTVSCTGYNLIGPRIGEIPITCSEWLAGQSVSAVLGFNADTDQYFVVRSTDLVYPGQGYWVFYYNAPETRGF
jgi:hypothetical protein